MHSSSCRRLCPHLQRHGAFRHAQAGQSVRHILVCVWLWTSPWRGRHLDGCWLHCGCMAPAHHRRQVQQGTLRPVGQYLQTCGCLQVIQYSHGCASCLTTR